MNSRRHRPGSVPLLYNDKKCRKYLLLEKNYRILSRLRRPHSQPFLKNNASGNKKRLKQHYLLSNSYMLKWKILNGTDASTGRGTWQQIVLGY